METYRGVYRKVAFHAWNAKVLTDKVEDDLLLDQFGSWIHLGQNSPKLSFAIQWEIMLFINIFVRFYSLVFS